MKFKILFTLALWLTSDLLFAQDSIQGIWQTGEENTKVETYEKDGEWFGKIISSDNEKAKIGKDILLHFTKSKSKWNGKLYAAKRDKILDAEIVPGKDMMKLKVRAGIFKKELSWKREK